MLYFAKWKIATILAICLIGVVYAAPNFFSGRGLEGLPTWLPVQKINLGLDLQGGSHLLLEVEADAVIRDRVQALEGVVRAALRPENIGYRSEEHTSELQSLMRISYAVFCLKKKNNNATTHANESPVEPDTVAQMTPKY